MHSIEILLNALYGWPLNNSGSVSARPFLFHLHFIQALGFQAKSLVFFPDGSEQLCAGYLSGLYTELYRDLQPM